MRLTDLTWPKAQEYFEKNEGCIFIKERPLMEKVEFKAPGNFLKKFKYFIKGFLGEGC